MLAAKFRVKAAKGLVAAAAAAGASTGLAPVMRPDHTRTCICGPNGAHDGKDVDLEGLLYECGADEYMEPDSCAVRDPMGRQSIKFRVELDTVLDCAGSD